VARKYTSLQLQFVGYWRFCEISLAGLQGCRVFEVAGLQGFVFLGYANLNNLAGWSLCTTAACSDTKDQSPKWSNW